MKKGNKLSSLLLAIFMASSIFLGGCATKDESVNTNKNVQQKTEAQKLEEQKKKEDEEAKKKEEEKKNKLSELSLVEAKVTKVVDVNTIEIEDGRKVRLIGVNTSSTNKNEQYGKDADSYTKSQLEGKTIYLEKDVSETDESNRLLRYVWTNIPKDKSDSEIRENMFNAALLINGFAKQSTYKSDVKYKDNFGKYSTEARNGNKGLWGIKTNVNTKSDNKQVKKSSTQKSTNKNNIKSNAKSRSSKPKASSNQKQGAVWLSATGEKYHAIPNCGRMNPNRASKVTLQEAIDRGYDPCSKCF